MMNISIRYKEYTLIEHDYYTNWPYWTHELNKLNTLFKYVERVYSYMINTPIRHDEYTLSMHVDCQNTLTEHPEHSF